MVFSSLPFLFFYLPVVLAIYRLSPLFLRNFFLLLASLFFYGWGEPVYVGVMFLSIFIDYTHGLLVEKFRQRDRLARWFVGQSVVFNLLLLGFFKYYNFIAGSLAAVGLSFLPVIDSLPLPGGTIPFTLPIGISFYTFQTMSYTIDVYRGDARCQKNIVTFGTFVTLFPQLIAGPIIKYKDLDEQLEHRDHTVEKFASGVQRFTIGACKKVLLANALGPLWDVYLATPGEQLTTLGAWLGIVAFSLQLYFDFSGYSDMAIGLGRMLGFEFLKNFDYPFISKSISEFWRRWHISLGSWFREYVYFPVGGSRKGKWRTCLNLLIVWSLTGIWHGAAWNFVLWGLYFGVLILCERTFWGKALEKFPGWLQHVYTLFLVIVSFAIFGVEDMAKLPGYLAAMFGFAGGGVVNAATLYYLRSYLPVLLVSFVAATPLVTNLVKRHWGVDRSKVGRVLLPIGLMAGMVLCTAYLVDATYNPFLYFRF